MKKDARHEHMISQHASLHFPFGETISESSEHLHHGEVLQNDHSDEDIAQEPEFVFIDEHTEDDYLNDGLFGKEVSRSKVDLLLSNPIAKVLVFSLF